MRTSSSRDWRVSQDALDRLLAALDSDRERAGHRYQEIRRSLEKFFWWRGAEAYDELADQTIDRVMRRMADGEEIRAGDPALYFYGVARNVLREHWAAEGSRRVALFSERSPAPLFDPARDEAEVLAAERRHACLDRCLALLPPETRALLLRYYQDEKAAKSETRQALAQEQGIGLNALRIRVHRIRLRLEPCLRRCMGEGKR